MSELAKPELNRVERLTRDHVLPYLPSEYGDPADMGEEKLKIARSILAKEYVEHANLKVLWKTGFILLAYDWLFSLNSQIYGLVLGMLGSIALALPTFYTPEILAQSAFDKSETWMAKLRAKAEISVKTNVGVFGLVLGFVWQILAISGPIPVELLLQNHLQGRVQNWLGFVAVMSVGYLTLGKGISDIRTRL